MPTLAQIVDDRAELTIGEGDAALHIVYRPRQTTTPAVLKIARDMELTSETGFDASDDDALDLIDRLIQAMCDTFVSWDLLEESGEVVALTPRRLERIDLVTLATLFGGVIQHARAGVGEATGTRSQTPSSGTAGRAARSTTGRKGASRKS
jgi:hypothetical protein